MEQQGILTQSNTQIKIKTCPRLGLQSQVVKEQRVQRLESESRKVCRMSPPPPTPTKRFWNAAADLIAVTEKHPFLVAMVDGTLDIDPFKYYVVQDAIYLTSFAACLNLLGDKLEASGHDAHSKRMRELAVGAEEDEKALHRGVFKQLDIEATSEAMPHTLLYTANMTSVVATRPAAEGLVSLLPCFWIYWHVGKKMLELRDRLGETVGRPSSYDAWIDSKLKLHRLQASPPFVFDFLRSSDQCTEETILRGRSRTT